MYAQMRRIRILQQWRKQKNGNTRNTEHCRTVKERNRGIEPMFGACREGWLVDERNLVLDITDCITEGIVEIRLKGWWIIILFILQQWRNKTMTQETTPKTCDTCLYCHCSFYNTPCETCIDFNNYVHANKEHCEYQEYSMDNWILMEEQNNDTRNRKLKTVL